MKRSILFLSIIPLILTAQRSSNDFTLGLKVGIAFTEAFGARVNGYEKKGFVGGLTFRLRLAKRWTGQIESIFIEKGSRNSGKEEDGYLNNYLLQLRYWELPVLFRYHRNRCAYYFGPGFGFLLDAREYFNDGRNGNGNLANDNPANQSEFSVNLGFSCPLNNRWGLDLRYTNSLIPVRRESYAKPAWYKRGMFNAVLAITLARNFRLSKDKKAEIKGEE